MGPMRLEELAQAARKICSTTSGYPHRVACELRYCFAHASPSDDPLDVVRELIVGILSELEVQWNRAEDAPDWPDEEET